MIYLDNASTTKPIYANEFWGNASSLYKHGRIAKERLDYCKTSIENIFNSDGGVVFTSGATESNNWVIRNIIDKNIENKSHKPHVIISPIEHPSVKNIIQYYLQKDLIDVSYMNVDRKGHVIVDDIESLITNKTCFLSCMYANNEIGSLQDIKAIGNICNDHNIVFHVDATQAVGKVNIDMQSDNIDYLTFSGHKIHGPKGVGCLVAKNLNMLSELGPFLIGGHQQNNFRAGTENVTDIYNMTSALLNRVKNGYFYIEKITTSINLYIEQKLKECFNNSEYIINSYDYNIPVFSVSFKDISGEYIVSELDKKDIYISTGSACTSGDLEPSYVLEAIKCPDDYIQGTIRISFDCYETSYLDINQLFVELKNIIKNN